MDHPIHIGDTGMILAMEVAALAEDMAIHQLMGKMVLS
jgi:hypothetical protein